MTSFKHSENVQIHPTIAKDLRDAIEHSSLPEIGNIKRFSDRIELVLKAGCEAMGIEIKENSNDKK